MAFTRDVRLGVQFGWTGAQYTDDAVRAGRRSARSRSRDRSISSGTTDPLQGSNPAGSGSGHEFDRQAVESIGDQGITGSCQLHVLAVRVMRRVRGDGEQLLEEDACFQPGEVVADAGMRAGPEGEVPVVEPGPDRCRRGSRRTRGLWSAAAKSIATYASGATVVSMRSIRGNGLRKTQELLECDRDRRAGSDGKRCPVRWVVRKVTDAPCDKLRQCAATACQVPEAELFVVVGQGSVVDPCRDDGPNASVPGCSATAEDSAHLGVDGLDDGGHPDRRSRHRRPRP